METDENKAQNTSQGDSGTNKATKRVNTDKSNESGTQASPELSEELRKVAFKYDESDYRHWIPLLIADKIGKIEEILEDLAPDNNILDSIVEQLQLSEPHRLRQLPARFREKLKSGAKRNQKTNHKRNHNANFNHFIITELACSADRCRIRNDTCTSRCKTKTESY
jgi:hypothetical protein